MKFFSLSACLHLVIFGLAWWATTDGSIKNTQVNRDKLAVHWVVASVPKSPTSQPNPVAQPAPKTPVRKSSQSATQPQNKSIGRARKTTQQPVASGQVSDTVADSDISAMQLSYTQQLKLFIERNKFYPRRARKLNQTGTVVVRVQITNEGVFRKIEITESSPHRYLNQAAINLLQKLARFKPLPRELHNARDFVIPIAYRQSRR